MKRFLRQFILTLSMLLGVVGLNLATTSAAYAFSVPTTVAAAQGSVCDLPDGSTGTVVDGNGTCCPPGTTPGVDQGSSSCLFGKYINPLIRFLSVAIGIVVVIAVIYGGIEYITSGGDPQKANEGRKHITNALIGLAAFVLLYAFLQFIIPGGL